MGKKKPTARDEENASQQGGGGKSKKKAVVIDDDEYSVGTELSEEPAPAPEEKPVAVGKKKGNAKGKSNDDDVDEDEDVPGIVFAGKKKGKNKKGGGSSAFTASGFDLLGDEEDDDEEKSGLTGEVDVARDDLGKDAIDKEVVEKLETHTIAAWREAKVQESRTDSNGRTYSQHLVHAGPLECLKDVALKILQNKVATVPIIHFSSEDDSFPQLLHLVSLTVILKCICRHFEHSSDSLPILQLPIGSIPVGTWVSKVRESNKRPLAMLRPNASLGDALSMLIQAEVSSIPIVDNNDSLLDIYSRRDIIALVKDKVYARISLARFSIHQNLSALTVEGQVTTLIKAQGLHGYQTL